MKAIALLFVFLLVSPALLHGCRGVSRRIVFIHERSHFYWIPHR